MRKGMALAVSTLLLSTMALADNVKYDIKELPITASEIVKANQNSKVLYIADKRELADSLTGGVLALENSGALLTIDSDNISQEEMQLIDSASSFYILGGPMRVSESLDQKPNFKGRISGYSRFETATKLGQALGNSRNLVIVNGLNYIDSITATALAAQEDRNILLTSNDQIPEETKAYLSNYGFGKDIIFVGGELSISRQVKEEIYALTGKSPDTIDANTIAGESRVETSVKLAKRLEAQNLILVDGEDLNSAMMSVNFLNQAGTSTVLTNGDKKAVLDSYYNGAKPGNIYSMGVDLNLSAVEAKKDEPKKEEPAPAPAKTAQSFIDAALKMEGWMYSQSMRMADGYADCSSLVLKALINSGLTTDTSRNLTTGSIWSDPRFYQVPRDQVKPGDVLYSPGHVAIFIEGDTCFEAKDWGVPAGYGHWLSRFTAAFRIKGL